MNTDKPGKPGEPRMQPSTPRVRPVAQAFRLRSRPVPRGASGHRQRGVAAVEFALVFPVVFLMVYGMITFALILLAQQTLTLAVGEGARAALRYSANPVAAACAAVNSSTSWLGSNLVNCSSTSTTAPTVVACPYQSSASCLQVTAIYPYASEPLVPTLPFLNLVLPNQIVATTIVQLEPVLATQ